MKVVVIGGGTGLSQILRGLKHIAHIDLRAIVTISDDGGSTGLLSHHFSIPAVGDIRRVLGAMSIERENLEKALEYRFKNTNSQFDGHSLGNIIILSQILRTGSFLEGITSASQILNINGQIIPIAAKMNGISAKFDDGSIVVGESNFYKRGRRIERVFFQNGDNVDANEKAIQEIMDADYIIIGIGSLFTSIIPNLIYPRIITALKNATAPIIYFANITIEKGETTGMSLRDHISAIENHTFKNIIDSVIVSTTPIPEHVIQKYHDSGQGIIVNDLHDTDMKIYFHDLLTFENDFIRHDPNLIEKAFKEILIRDDFYPED